MFLTFVHESVRLITTFVHESVKPISTFVHENVRLASTFVSNDYKSGKKVLNSIEDELLRCDKFQISVVFITMSGITPLLQILKRLEEKNIPGEITKEIL